MFNWQISECHRNFYCWQFISHIFLSSPSVKSWDRNSMVFIWNKLNPYIFMRFQLTPSFSNRPTLERVPSGSPLPLSCTRACVLPSGGTQHESFQLDLPWALWMHRHFCKSLIVIKPLFRLNRLTALWKERRDAHWVLSWQKDPDSRLQHHFLPHGAR